MGAQAADYGYHLVFSFTPVRSDGEAGPAVFSTPSAPVMPPVPVVDATTVSGQCLESCHVEVQADVRPPRRPSA